MSNMLRTYQRQYCRNNGKEFKPKHPGKKRFKGGKAYHQQELMRMFRNPLDANSLISSFLIVAGMQQIKQRQGLHRKAA